MQPVIFGTAGHIDHGKTALVKALTGEDTDRLKEEKERGITIELGYAFLDENIAFIDVPGHERFIKNMVAGAATVDFAMLVIAADDGIMPQTREHFEILNLLRIKGGLLVITKCDLVEDAWIDLVEEELVDLANGSYFENSPVFRVDALSGRGIDALKSAIVAKAQTKRPEILGDIFRLPVDRVFSIKGFGTVVTGSVLSGQVAVEDRLELLPSRTSLRVRSLESHGEVVSSVRAGMRAALNLPQVSVNEIHRGDVMATPERLVPTFMLDVSLSMLESSPISLKQRDRIRLHVGTKELMARVHLLDHMEIGPGETGLVQFRLEEQTAVQRLDRFVVRRYSPPLTIGGGEILDANPPKHRKRHEAEVLSTLRELENSKTAELLIALISKNNWLVFNDIVTKSALSKEQVHAEIDALKSQGELLDCDIKGKTVYATKRIFDQFETELVETLESFHTSNPLKLGPQKGEVLGRFKKRFPDALLSHFLKLATQTQVIESHDAGILSICGFEVQLTKKERFALNAMELALKQGRFNPPDRAALDKIAGLTEKVTGSLLQLLVDRGQLINLDGKIYFHISAIEEATTLVRGIFKEKEGLTLSDFRVLLDTTRKYAMPLINYFDGIGITVRNGDVRNKGPRLTS